MSSIYSVLCSVPSTSTPYLVYIYMSWSAERETEGSHKKEGFHDVQHKSCGLGPVLPPAVYLVGVTASVSFFFLTRPQV